MKPDNRIPKLIAVIIILLGVELVANFVLSSEARSKYVDNNQAVDYVKPRLSQE